MNFGAWSYLDMFRILFTLMIAFLVAYVVVPLTGQIWILYLAVFTVLYTVILELAKFQIGMKQMHSKRQKKLVIRNPSFD